MWKLRPVVDILQQRFQPGWTLPAVFSFDEGVLPATCRRNTTRILCQINLVGLKSMLERENQQKETPPVSTTRLV
ncbi:hypothetical protein PPTG_21264 [Phytophthora nicotianae INRA-310]|uniref:PiggyBac transposable element-derived protein domain-containing protein n=1 Tax=Phytophthora nicotianae (strain INRA-310) TaxID=761204 RepID=W2R4R7_PHYN3|nr:hypothetical protein PPTG_21264 [Phytophthora nicotianae INRA-310]ETN20246.1 hypothetical protein PPTG_21264 [Phytophthora nicotianae INRA-310]